MLTVLDMLRRLDARTCSTTPVRHSSSAPDVRRVPDIEQLFPLSPATKGAIVSFTRGCANQLASKDIRVNAVAPGPIVTPLVHSTFSADVRDSAEL